MFFWCEAYVWIEFEMGGVWCNIMMHEAMVYTHLNLGGILFYLFIKGGEV